MGGIASGRDAADFLAAGVRCVAVGTESFRDPAAGRRVARELDAISRKERALFDGDRRESNGGHKTPAKKGKTVKSPEG
jgi:dihydroorotate dehydrogenase